MTRGYVMKTNQTVSPKKDKGSCEDCKGTGLGFKGRVNLAIPIDKSTNLKSVKEYVERVLLCDTCKGTGKDYSK